MNRPRMLIVNPILFHYRRGVFVELDQHPDVEVTFASDLGTLDGIAAMDPGDLHDHVALRTRSFMGIRWQSGVLRLLLKQRYEAAVFLGDVKYASTWVGAIVARLRGSRVAFWTIGWHRPERGVKRLIRLWFYHIANVTMLYGQIAQRIGEEMGFPVGRMTVIGNSVANTPGAHATEVAPLPIKAPGEKWLGAVIRLNAVKRLDLLVDAAHVLRNRGVDVHLLFGGDGPARAHLEEATSRLGVPALFTGEVYGEPAVRGIYELLDVTVVPAAVGLTAIQSLAHGVPVVSDNSAYTQMPEWEAIIPGETGDVYQPGDVNGLADAIERVIDRTTSSPSETADRCRREVALHWSPQGHAERIVNAALGLDDYATTER